MVPQWLIEKKRDGGVFTSEEIHAWIEAVTAGTLPDYQIAAWLMAVYLKGMTSAETAALTDAMLHSGTTITFPETLPTVDKHSTGGIGDKISIPLAPLAAAMGVAVPMISGRGLGITGGTLDKLETIPGMNVRLSIEAFKQQVATLGCAMIGQTDELAPADRKLYALRDVTGTVPSVALITASILSKKLAEGARGLLFDVKFGTGAFMQTLADAEVLAQSLLSSAKRLGRHCYALVTEMNQPLGRTIGNALEIAESIAILQGQGPDDVRDLVIEEAAYMALLATRVPTLEAGRALAKACLSNGTAWEKYCAMVRAQGGDPEATLPTAKVARPILAETAGFVARVDALKMGQIALQLGAGRTSVTGKIDPGAGIGQLCQQGDAVKVGDVLGVLYGETDAGVEAQVATFRAAITLQAAPISPRQVIYRVCE